MQLFTSSAQCSGTLQANASPSRFLQALPAVDLKETRAAPRLADNDGLLELFVSDVGELLLVVLVDPLLLDLLNLVFRHEVYGAAAPSLQYSQHSYTSGEEDRLDIPPQ